jgi:hypothetical protein
MAQLFVRVELRGTPGNDVYEKLNTHMASLFWYPWIIGSIQVDLPQATYQATISRTPKIATLGENLKKSIEANIWPQALVLVVVSSNWAQTAG